MQRFFIVLGCLTALFLTSTVSAQQLGIAEYIPVEQENIPDGSILVHQSGQYVISQEPYSKDLFGVVSRSPAMELAPPANDITPQTLPLLKSGVTPVRVNGEGGVIQEGDFITTSSTPGVGMKAAQSGFVLGIAQESFTPDSPEQEILLPVLLDIKFAFADDAPESQRIISRLMSVVSLNTISFVEEPVKSLRYTAAVGAVLISMTLSFLTFGRVAYKGVEALGRNPLAQGSILTGIVFNVILAVGLIGMGVATAYILVTW